MSDSKTTAERLFPILGTGERIPWRLLEPHERQARRNHDQTLEVLASRGGLSWCEALAVLEGRPWRRMSQAAAETRVKEIVQDAE